MIKSNKRRSSKFWSDFAQGKIVTLDEFKAARSLQHKSRDPARVGERFLGTYHEPMAPALVRASLELWSYFDSEDYLRQMHVCDWQTVSLKLRYFGSRYIERMRRLGIPLYIHRAYCPSMNQSEPHCHGAALTFRHCTLGINMGEACLNYLWDEALIVAFRAGLDFEPDPSPLDPLLFVDGEAFTSETFLDPPLEPFRCTPRRMSQHSMLN